MTCSCVPQTEIFGSDPANVQWRIVRGDTGSIRFEFWEDDETTPIDISDWTFTSHAYNSVSGTGYDLDTNVQDNYVDVTVDSEVTSTWGTSNSSVVAELSFDLQVNKLDSTIWTPIIGTICVLGDTPGGSL